MKPTMIALAAALASGTLQAEETLNTLLVEGQSETELQTTDNPRVSEADGAVEVTAEDIEKLQATSLKEALAGNASVIIDEDATSSGSTITIRGLSGADVSVRVEGVSNSRYLTSHRTVDTAGDEVWLNMDMYESITVIPGAAANTYGSGSTGGVVLLETKDPESVLKDKDFAANLRYKYSSNGQSNGLSADVAKKINEKFSVNATVSGSQTKPYEDANGTPSTDNDETTDDFSYLVKGVYTPDSTQRFELSLMENNTDYASGEPSELERYEVEDQTISGQYSYNPKDNPLVDLKVRASIADSDRHSDQGANDWLSTGGVETTYAEIENTSVLFPTENTMHVLRYGADYNNDDVRLQSGYTYEGEPMSSQRQQIGGYLSDTMHIGDDLQLSGSLRYDSYAVDGFAGDEVDGKSALSSKLSTIWKPFENSSLQGLGFTALVGTGYKAPNLFDLYGKHKVKVFQATDNGDGTFTTDDISPCLETDNSNKGGGTCFLPNTNLKGESTFSKEIGLVFDRKNVFTAEDALTTKLNYFHTDVEDQITTELAGTVTYDGTTYNVNQSVNKDEAVLYGWELAIGYENSSIFSNLTLQDIGGYSINDDGSTSNNTGLSPRNISASIGSYFADKKGRVGVDAKYRQGRSYTSTSRGVTTNNVYQSYTVYNLFGSYEITDQLSVSARIDNFTDELYTTSSITTDATTGEDTTSYKAGRAYRVGVNYRF